jgi:uncharacterized protein
MSLLLDVSKLREPHLHLERTDEPPAFGAEEIFRIVSPVQLVFDLHKDPEKIRIVGTVKTVLELDCSRCLDGFAVPIDASFDLLYVPATAAQGSEEKEIEEDDLDTAYYREGVIDLADLVREQLYLTLPMKPLCQEGCRGLCPACGTNLNSGTCNCAPAWEDPRLAPLKALARKKSDA